MDILYKYSNVYIIYCRIRSGLKKMSKMSKNKRKANSKMLFRLADEYKREEGSIISSRELLACYDLVAEYVATYCRHVAPESLTDELIQWTATKKGCPVTLAHHFISPGFHFMIWLNEPINVSA